MIFILIAIILSLYKVTKYNVTEDKVQNKPIIYTVKGLKIIPQGRWMSDLFVITEQGKVINLKYDSETFAKLKIGDKISISERAFSNEINILKN